jgi:threonylcarbamoyladenosine tRNA methylthiotransferase MtaB
MKTFFITTLGCKVNQYDSRKIKEVFLRNGWKQGVVMSEADVCVVNTCCVTAQADRKSRYAIRYAVRQGPRSKIYVTGCYAVYNRQALEAMDGVDAVFKTEDRDHFLKNIFPEEGREDIGNALFLSCGGATRAFLKIQDGCDNGCSYCVIPVVRGPSRSRGPEAVFREARDLVMQGHKEIVLTGICLGAYGTDLDSRTDLVDVIEDLETIDGLVRIRLSSIEAGDVSDRLIDKMASSSKLCPHLHIPFQSGDDTILAGMNKRLRTRDYRKIVHKARKAVPKLAVTCDLIVGFPGEKEENVRNTITFLEDIAPLRTHLFTFSPRKGTPLYVQKTSIPLEVQRKRYDMLKSVADKAASRVMRQNMKKELDVLFEGRENGYWRGYSENYIRVAVESSLCLENKIMKVRLTEHRGDLAFAEIVDMKPNSLRSKRMRPCMGGSKKILTNEKSMVKFH